MKKQEEKRDLRVIKTHRKLRLALGALMKVKPYEEISVIEICDAANVRRATFYRHFADKHSFIMHSVDLVAGEISEIALQKYGMDDLTAYIVGYVREIFNYLSDKRDITDNIFKSRGVSSFHEIVLASAEKLMHEDILVAEKMGIRVADDNRAAVAFITGGIANMVSSFIKTRDVNTEAFLSELETILNKLFMTK